MGAAWKENEDKLLTKIVLECCKRGETIAAALAIAAKKLNRSYSACETRWYDNFQELYKQEIKSVKRTNDYVGEWSAYEDEKFMNMMVNLIVQGFKVSEAIQECTKSLGRSVSSCQTRWYNYIVKRNRLTIQNMIEKGKQEMIAISRIWTKEEEEKALQLALKLLNEGQQVKDVLIEIAKELKKNTSQVRKYWYSYIFPENKEAIHEAQGRKPLARQIDSWTEEQQYELYKIVMAGREAGHKMMDIINSAAIKLGRSFNECNNIWYHYVRDNEEFAKRYNEEKETMKTQKIETAKLEPVKIVSNELQEFINKVEKLVQRNKELEAENAQLKAENAKLKAEAKLQEEFRKEYNELLKTLERARQFIVNSELNEASGN